MLSTHLVEYYIPTSLSFAWASSPQCLSTLVVFVVSRYDCSWESISTPASIARAMDAVSHRFQFPRVLLISHSATISPDSAQPCKAQTTYKSFVFTRLTRRQPPCIQQCNIGSRVNPTTCVCTDNAFMDLDFSPALLFVRGVRRSNRTLASERECSIKQGGLSVHRATRSHTATVVFRENRGVATPHGYRMDTAIVVFGDDCAT